ncbi:MAG: hypothetical protein HYX80_09905 [Chloroflexi bacterium]|nr:hypothetical protein [Chloroflexota bacterium]
MKLVHKILVLGVIALIPVISSCSSNNASAAAAAKIGERINCICGTCGLTVTTCVTNGGCDVAPKQMTFIKKELSKGLTEEQIRHDMVGTYGQRALVE